MLSPDRRTANILVTIVLFAIAGAAIYYARQVILIFVFAIFFAYLIDPVVKLLQRHSFFFKDLRGPAVVEIYLALVLLIAVLGYQVAPSLATSSVKLIDDFPVLVNGEIVNELGSKYGWSEKEQTRAKSFLTRHKTETQDLVRIADRYLSHAAQAFVCLILIAVLAIFVLRDGEQIANDIIQVFIPSLKRPRPDCKLFSPTNSSRTYHVSAWGSYMSRLPAGIATPSTDVLPTICPPSDSSSIYRPLWCPASLVSARISFKCNANAQPKRGITLAV